MAVACKNKKLVNWVAEVQAMVKPDKVVWCDGSKAEYDAMIKIMVEAGAATPLKKRPNSYLFRSRSQRRGTGRGPHLHRVRKPGEAGPTNNWIDPVELKETMSGLYDGCMKGRTMYVIPFSMGPIGSPIAKIGVEITDSPYVVVNMHIMTRVGDKVLDRAWRGRRIHSVPAFRRRAAGARAAGRALALRSDREEVHRPFPRREPDLVLRFRLRRQRPAGQEVSGAAYCLRHGPPRRLDGRAHAHPAPDQSRRQAVPHCRGLSQRLRQNQPGHAPAHDSGLEVRMHRRRHCLDEDQAGRASARHQPGSRFLRRCPGHELQVQSHGHGKHQGEFHLHQLRPDR